MCTISPDQGCFYGKYTKYMNGINAVEKSMLFIEWTATFLICLDYSLALHSLFQQLLSLWHFEVDIDIFVNGLWVINGQWLFSWNVGYYWVILFIGPSHWSYRYP